MIEELDDILEELANEAAVYGERRCDWVPHYRNRIERAIEVANRLKPAAPAKGADWRDARASTDFERN